MDALKSLVQPLVGGSAGSSVIDGMKLVVLGGTVETARRVSSSAWSHFVNSFFLTAHFCEEDFPYDWLMLWLSRCPEWQRSREFETTTRPAGPGGSSSSHYSAEDADWDQWEVALSNSNSNAGAAAGGMEGGGDPDNEGRPKTRVVFQPTYDTTHTIYYRGHWLRVRRGRKPDSCSEMLSISVVARSNAILKQLVLQAKKEYEAEAVHRIQIYFADAHGSWRWTDSRHKRPMNSIVLNPGVKEMLIEDARDFLKSEKWYADRGIPFRRGYLLHGVPGSGKSSLIHALAGQLQLDIYVVSLSANWISDNTLTTLMGRVPARCVLLLEDLDAAFVRTTNREDDNNMDMLDAQDPPSAPNLSTHAPDPFPGLFGGSGSGLGSGGGSGGTGRRRYGRSSGLSDMNTLSLSGLLNALDGVAASEGRLLFATTNHLERLDPALSRPGRMDVWVEFKNASKWQAEALFRNFFPCEEDEIPEADDDELEGLDLDVKVQDEQGKIKTFVPSAEPNSSHSRSQSRRGRGGGGGADHPSDETPPPSSGLPSLWSLSTSFASSASSLLSGGNHPGSTPTSGTTSPLPLSSSFSPSSTLNSPSPATPETFASSPVQATPLKDQFGASNTAYLPPPPDASLTKAKPLDRRTLASLAKRFADGLPEEEFSVASLQGYLLKHKAQPEAAALGVEAWVESEREMRERLQREKEAREVREKALREKRRKEALEKDKARKAQDKKEQELEKVKALLAEKEKEEELEKMRQQLKDKENERRKKKEDKKRNREKKAKGKGRTKEEEEVVEEKKEGDEKEKDEEEKAAAEKSTKEDETKAKEKKGAPQSKKPKSKKKVEDEPSSASESDSSASSDSSDSDAESSPSEADSNNIPKRVYSPFSNAGSDDVLGILSMPMIPTMPGPMPVSPPSRTKGTKGGRGVVHSSNSRGRWSPEPTQWTPAPWSGSPSESGWGDLS